MTVSDKLSKTLGFPPLIALKPGKFHHTTSQHKIREHELMKIYLSEEKHEIKHNARVILSTAGNMVEREGKGMGGKRKRDKVERGK